MAAGTTRRERKVVTVVFCDLVGFTSQAETMDPEDVDALLGPYHERLRRELEQRGGTVEKFIGDAVMALFGAPTAHEDDPERAVRACLAIRDWAREEEGVQVRIAATTGEALIRLDARPEAGEGMASGDVVNTAARLQAASPVNGVLVDETTFRATRRVVDYREAPPVEAKGKVAPIAVWEAIAARSRFGVDLDHVAKVGLVGRERELALLRETFERARHERVAQLLTLVGVPGLGKSRLVYELRRIAEDDEELITWRQGHCLAYGDGVTMWALGEIVKAQAGVLEGDSPDDVRAKIHRAVEDTLPESSDADWIEAQLLALVGQGVQAELGGDRRGQAFAAWRRYLEALAEHRPLVLVFEDLHWADESLLDFVDELVDWITDVPLLVVGTARPELLSRRQGWGGGKLNATTVALSPLSDQQTSALIGSLLGRPVLAGDHQTLLENAGGNPLYAEQFADLYLERGSAEQLSLPETLQGLIGARLDGLDDDEKALLQDAAVVGKVFWSGSLGREPASAGTALHSLERKGFVRRQRQSSIDGESEYAFGHALVRDVAYGQIPRSERAAKHRAVATWIASLGRPEDHAEMLVHHFGAALELVRASGGDDAELAATARRASATAGDRAASLNAFVAAASHYEWALELSNGEAGVPELLFKRAQALFTAGDAEAVDALERARDALLSAGNRTSAAECEALLGRVHWLRGEANDVFPHLETAERLIQGASPCLGVARVLAWSARQRMLAGEREQGLAQAREALALAEQLQLDEIRIHALTTIGSAKEFLSDTSGREDLRRAIDIARSTNSPLLAGALNNLSVALDTYSLRETDVLAREALEQAVRFGDREIARFMVSNLVVGTWLTCQWDEAIELADEFIAECEAGSPHVLEGATRLARACIELARGRRDAAIPQFNRALELARETRNDPQELVPALIRGAWAQLCIGDVQRARALFGEAIPLLKRDPYSRPWMLPELALDLGATATVREVMSQLPPTPVRRAGMAVLDGDFRSAAVLYEQAGVLLFEAEARLRLAEQLIGDGRGGEGQAELEKALAVYRPIGAVLFIERGERLRAREAAG
jgi:class 3 adenylate cyclase/tetratricopeptide (TPR) repeat protein